MSGSVLFCASCGQTKPSEDFSRDRAKVRRGGRSTYCLECDLERARLYYKRVRERKSQEHLSRRLAEHGPRMCAKGCGRKATSQRHIYCAACRQQAVDDRLQRRGKMSVWGLMLAREKEARRSERRRREGLTAAARGYDEHHRRERQRVADVVARGQAVCARCHLPILPVQEWDLGHDDLDRSRYAGPEHRFSADCPAGGNRATARHKAERMKAA